MLPGYLSLSKMISSLFESSAYVYYSQSSSRPLFSRIQLIHSVMIKHVLLTCVLIFYEMSSLDFSLHLTVISRFINSDILLDP